MGSGVAQDSREVADRPPPPLLLYIQPDQITMAVFFLHLVKCDARVRYCSCSVHWAIHFLQSTRNTRPCLTDHPVLYKYGVSNFRVINTQDLRYYKSEI